MFDALDPTLQQQALTNPNPVPFTADQAQALRDRGLLSDATYAKLNFPQPAPMPEAPAPAAEAPAPMEAPQPIPMSEPLVPNSPVPVSMPADTGSKDLLDGQPAPAPVQPLDLSPLTRGIDEQQAAIQQAAALGIAKGAEQGAAYANADQAVQKQNALSLAKQTEIQKNVDAQMAKVNSLTNELAGDKIDPNKFWAEKSTGQKILAGISIFLGGFGRNGNDAFKIINDSIDNDINAQKFAIQNKRDSLGQQQNLLATFKGALKDEQLSLQAAKVAALDKAAMQTNAIAAKYAGAETQQKADVLVGQLQTQKDMLLQQMQAKLTSNAQLQSDSAGSINPELLTDKQRERFVPGYGLALTMNDASKMKEAASDIITAKNGIKRLKEIADLPFKSVNPDTIAEAGSVAQILQGSLRTLLVGPGAVNENERKLIESVISNPTNITTLDSSNKIRLDTLMKRLDVSLANKAQLFGLKPQKAEKTEASTDKTRKFTE